MARIRKLKRITSLLLLVLMLAAVMAPASFAFEKIDPSMPLTLTVKFTNGPKVSGVEFRAYRVADIDENANFTFIDAMAEYGLVMASDQEGYRALAETLAGYVSRDGITPTAIAYTDGDGSASFGELEKGLYLVVSRNFVDPSNNMTYVVSPSLIALPNSVDRNTWIYDVTISPKYTSVPPVPTTGGETVDINVIKVWTGEANQDKRPEYVYAEIVCDGVIIDTVTLNSGNNWRYTWKDLDAKKTYNVTEKEVPPGYTVTVTRDGNTFTINNYSGDVPPVTPPSTPRLPQTGQLWWPLPLLIVGGILLIVLGAKRKKA